MKIFGPNMEEVARRPEKTTERRELHSLCSSPSTVVVKFVLGVLEVTRSVWGNRTEGDQLEHVQGAD